MCCMGLPYNMSTMEKSIKIPMRAAIDTNNPQAISIATALIQISEDLKVHKEIVFKPLILQKTLKID